LVRGTSLKLGRNFIYIGFEFSVKARIIFRARQKMVALQNGLTYSSSTLSIVT